MSADDTMIQAPALIDGPSAFAVAQLTLGRRAEQDSRWGIQDHEDGTGPYTSPLSGHRKVERYNAEELAIVFTHSTDVRFKLGLGTWRDVLLEEVFKALALDDAEALGDHLIDVAGVAQAWAEAIGRREAQHRAGIQAKVALGIPVDLVPGSLRTEADGNVTADIILPADLAKVVYGDTTPALSIYGDDITETRSELVAKIAAAIASGDRIAEASAKEKLANLEAAA